jgi:hypothetical protein
MHSYQNFMAATDRYNTRGADSETLHHLTHKLKFPVEDILRAVQEVGTNADDVEEYIRDRYNRT